MFTVCPKCALTLVVTAADLRVAQGYVRCGRCSSVFNALARLTEERGGASLPAAEAAAAIERATEPQSASDVSPEPPPAEGLAAMDSPAPPPEPPQPLSLIEENPPDEALEFNAATTDVNSVFVQPPPDPQWAAATGSFKALIAANDEPTPEPPSGAVDVEIDAAFFASMLRAEAAPVAPPPAPEPPRAPPASAAPASARASPARASKPAPRAAPEPRPAPPRKTPVPVFDRADQQGTSATPAQSSQPLSLAEDAESTEADTQSATQLGPLEHLRAHGWALGALAAALLLSVQVVNHYRDELAASARFNGPLTALYGHLGIKLYPHWDLHAYDVRQLGAAAEPDGPALITVRASIKNAAPQAQPLPLLRVTLQDRFGNRIAMRDVAPQSYLPASIPPASFLAAGQRIDAEMGFADPGTEAVGFEIDACLPARGGVACANDATLR